MNPQIRASGTGAGGPIRRALRALLKRIEIFARAVKHRRFDVESFVGRDVAQDGVAPQATIVILGMHRSGTSLVGEILSQAGLNLGAQQVRTRINNPRGYFENRVFVSLNDKILGMAGGTWDCPPSLSRVLDLKANDRLSRQVEIAIRSQEHRVWGWKDPRTSLTIDLYLRFLRHPRFIVCTRDRLAVAKSLNQRNRIALAEGIELAEYYEWRIAEFLQRTDAPTLSVQYETIIDNPEAEMERIQRFVGCERKPQELVVDRNLKHF